MEKSKYDVRIVYPDGDEKCWGVDSYEFQKDHSEIHMSCELPSGKDLQVIAYLRDIAYIEIEER